MQKIRYFNSQITGLSGLVNDPVNGLVTETAHEGRNEARSEAINEARSEAINEAVNGAVNDTVKCQRGLLTALFRHFTASRRNKCRYKCRNKNMVSTLPFRKTG